VSHDRAFLDNITNRTIDITLGRINDYKVPYSKYVEQRAERIALQMASYENQQKFIADTERFIDRFRSKASKATQVQSRIKALDKVERIQVEEQDTSVMRLRFPPAPRSGKVVVLAEGVSKKYGDLEVLKNVELMLDRGEKVALLGKNGEGKTTFSKIVVGELDYTGKFELGHNVAMGYYAQDQAESLDSSKTVFQTLDDVARGDVRTKLRDILGSFLFGGEDVDKKVSVLSGGERGRLALAKLLLEPVNLLVLDEPTNHLDMHSKDVLKQALQKYDGAMIIVSHDRDFLSGLTSKVYEFKDKNVKQHIGDVYEFLDKVKATSIQEFSAKPKVVEVKTESKKETKEELHLRKEREKEIRNAKNRADRLEQEISKLEKEIADLDELMLDAEGYKEALAERDVFKEYQQKQDALNAKMAEWEEAVDKHETLSNQ
jgi:ATP-binding cassette, subfamily F, member 3